MFMKSKFLDETIGIAKKFLQTAVIIDDNIKISDVIIPKSGLKSPQRGYCLAIAASAEHSSAQNDRYINSELLVDGFAAHGIICAVMHYKEESEDKFILAAQNADISILDWELEGSKNGESALKLISRLVGKDLATPQRFRLISIYTGSNDLKKISESIDSFFREKHAVEFLALNNGLKLVQKSIVITIYAKNEDGLINDFKSAAVSENDLSERLIADFAVSTSGILSNFALSSITAIRNNSHRLIAKFNPELDAAFVSHRILAEPPDEAQEHLIPLIVSELENILEDEDVQHCASYAAIQSWVENKLEQGHPLRKMMHIRQSQDDAKKELLSLIENGILMKFKKEWFRLKRLLVKLRVRFAKNH